MVALLILLPWSLVPRPVLDSAASRSGPCDLLGVNRSADMDRPPHAVARVKFCVFQRDPNALTSSCPGVALRVGCWSAVTIPHDGGLSSCLARQPPGPPRCDGMISLHDFSEAWGLLPVQGIGITTPTGLGRHSVSASGSLEPAARRRTGGRRGHVISLAHEAVQREVGRFEYQSFGVGELASGHQCCCQVPPFSAATIPHDGGLSCDRAWHSYGRLLSDAPVCLCVAGEDCYPTRVPGEAAGTSPTRDDRALTTYKEVESTSARRSELQRVHTCPSPDTALLRSETQHLYGSNGVERLGLACQGHSRLLPPHDAWRPDDWAVRDKADPTGTGKGYTVMLQPTGGQQVLAAKHTSSSAENKKLVGSETSEIPRRSSNPGPRPPFVARSHLAIRRA